MSKNKTVNFSFDDDDDDGIYITKKKSVGKEKIPATLRNSIWNLYIGSDKKNGTCFCCNTETISTANFQCGHIISEKEGGKLTINNLRPVCGLCNKSMGTQNMENFMTKHEFEKNKNWNGVKIVLEKENTINTINTTKNSQNYDTLDIKELQFLSKVLDIKGKAKNKITEYLLEKDFCYDKFYSDYIDNLTNDKLKILCKYLKLTIKKTKEKTKEMLLNQKIQLFTLEDIINEIKNKKYFIECSGSCVHSIYNSNDFICDKCDNSHTYSTNENNIENSNEIVMCSDSYKIKNNCKKCNAETTQYIYNNPFYNFIDKKNKLVFDSATEEKFKEIIKNNKENKNDTLKNKNKPLCKDIIDTKNFIETLKNNSETLKNNSETLKNNSENIKDNNEIEKLKNEIRELKIQIQRKEAESRHRKIVLDEKYVKIELDEPTKRCIGEKKSKLLLAGSELYNFINNLKKILRHNGFDHNDCLGLHIEVLNDDSESVEEFLNRIKTLEGKLIDIYNPNNYIIEGTDVGLKIGKLEGYNKETKITIAFFDNDKTHDALMCILNNI
jgi:hypothetical protein